VRWSEEFRPTYFDDVDFCYQARWLGEHVWYRPEVTLVHHQGSFQRAVPGAEVHGALARNQGIFTSKWGQRRLPHPPGG
jgi:GT2 family glycosyltransferase